MVLNYIKNIFNRSTPEEKLFEYIYRDIDSYSISRIARNKISKEIDEHLIYGELNFRSFSKIYNNKRIGHLIANAKTFYDLGSGAGKIIIASFLLLPNVKKLIGVELLEGLHNTSKEVKNRLKNELTNVNIEKIDFINDDFFNLNLSNADVIFLHYPMKNAEEMYMELEEKMKKELRTGAVVISAIRQLENSDTFQLVDRVRVHASYGKTTIYYYIKL